MGSLDFAVIAVYIIGIVAAGMIFSRKVKSSKDMFAAGGQSPWWVSGLSGFMTMFSAGTFVVWGGIAYKYGFVAVAINMCYGVAAMFVGYFLAGYWRKIGVNSAPEYLQLRFGPSIVQFYTWFQGIVGIFAVGGAIYALSSIVCALIPLPIGHLFADPNTGMLSISYTSIALCIMVILIAFSGGLWAVLMTDVLQFVILLVSVVFAVPLILTKAGGWSSFINKVPVGFTSPVAHDFTWWFLLGWVVIHFFKIGGEWSFVQRYTCVPTAKDAKKSAYLFGVLYLISPLFWMLPALVFRVINADVDSEQAYILACQSVLPAGMMGLMVAAMASATASSATSQLNVFAGAFTTEVYQRLISPNATESKLVSVGRIFTVILGLIIMIGALLIPKYGYTRFIIDITTLLTGPLVLPTIWGLFSKKIGIKTIWTTTLIGFIAAALMKFGFANAGFMTSIVTLKDLSSLIQENMRLADLFSGIVIPILVLLIFELRIKTVHSGYSKVLLSKHNFEETNDVQSSTMPAKMVSSSLGIIAIVMILIAFIDQKNKGLLFMFAAILLFISSMLFYIIRKRQIN